jgi:hypothetical protein
LQHHTGYGNVSAYGYPGQKQYFFYVFGYGYRVVIPKPVVPVKKILPGMHAKMFQG